MSEAETMREVIQQYRARLSELTGVPVAWFSDDNNEAWGWAECCDTWDALRDGNVESAVGASLASFACLEECGVKEWYDNELLWKEENRRTISNLEEYLTA